MADSFASIKSSDTFNKLSGAYHWCVGKDLFDAVKQSSVHGELINFAISTLSYGAFVGLTVAVFVTPPAFMLTSFLVGMALLAGYVTHAREKNCRGKSLFSHAFSKNGVRVFFKYLGYACLGLAALCVAALVFGTPVSFVSIPVVLNAAISMAAFCGIVIKLILPGPTSYEPYYAPPAAHPAGAPTAHPAAATAADATRRRSRSLRDLGSSLTAATGTPTLGATGGLSQSLSDLRSPHG